MGERAGIQTPSHASLPELRRVRPDSRAAFTLVEVILAVVIALGILVVVLYFYQQATNLRAAAIEQTEHIAAARLLMDRITGELRTAQAPSADGGFAGSSNSVSFVKADVPTFTAWTGGTLGRSAFPVTDLKRITYRLQSEDGTNTPALQRTEEPLVGKAQSPQEDLSQPMAAPAATNSIAPPVFEEIRFVQFRYWSGTNWLDVWNGSGLPECVEVSLGSESITNATELADYPGDLFRRVIYLGAIARAWEPSAKSSGAPASGEGAEGEP